MTPDLIERILALGPAGLLLLALLFQHRQSEKRIAGLEGQLTEAREELKGEHQARLADANANQRALLEVHDRTHKSIDVLAKQMEANEQQALRRR